MKRFPAGECVRAEVLLEGTNLLSKSRFARVNATYGDARGPVATLPQPWPVR